MNHAHQALYDGRQLSRLEVFKRDLRSKGIAEFLLARAQKRIINPLSRAIFLMTTGKKKYTVHGKTYRYLADWYNYTWTNERAIEIPYFIGLIKHEKSKNILEIGNTLSHYYPHQHEIIDKYEPGEGVKTTDVMDFHPVKKYDLIFAISTFEHIGWHEDSKDAKKALKAIEHLRSLLKSNGKLIFSIPLGVNPALDLALENKKLELEQVAFLKRIHRWNEWQQVPYEEVKDCEYNSPYPNANAILIAEMRGAPQTA